MEDERNGILNHELQNEFKVFFFLRLFILSPTVHDIRKESEMKVRETEIIRGGLSAIRTTV
jgi:hypothetical protein